MDLQYLLQMKFQFISTWFHESWHWPSPFAYAVLPNSKFNVSDQVQQSTKMFLRIFIVIIYFKVLRPQTKTKIRKQYIQSQDVDEMSKVKRT